MKKIYTILALSAVVFSCAKNEPEQQNVPSSKVDFIGTILEDNTKVTVDQGKSVWVAGDQISVFSVADGSTVGTNVIYGATSAGASTGFTAVADPIAEGTTYYAFSPAFATYPYKLNASGDYIAHAAGDPVIDYKYMPVAVNDKQAIVVKNGVASCATEHMFYYATGTAAQAGQPVQLQFKPVLPVIEFGIYGLGTLKAFRFEYADRTTDALDQANDNWFSSKGQFNLATGELVTTNSSSSAYAIMQATSITDEDTGNAYVNLSPDTPFRLRFTVGRFVVTKGLKITFTDKDGNTVSKTIWTDKTYSGCDASTGNCKHIYQPIEIPGMTVSSASVEFPVSGGSQNITVASTTPWTVSSKPDWATVSVAGGAMGSTEISVSASNNTAASRMGSVVLTNNDGVSVTISVSQEGLSTNYHAVDLSGIDWSVSNVHYVKNSSSEIIALVAKEFLGATINKQAVVVYPAPNGTPSYMGGVVAEVTLDAGAAASGNIHGGSVSFASMDHASASYSEGTSAALTTVYVEASGSAVFVEEPVGSDKGATSITPLTVVTDVKSHPCTKVGTEIWLACNFQTTKFVDGTSIPQYKAGDALWNDNADDGKALVIYQGSNGTNYLYSGYTIGFLGGTSYSGTNFAPAGWHVATTAEITTDLVKFMGSGTTMWANLSGQSLMNWSLMGKANSGTVVTTAMLSYGSIWSSTVNGSNKANINGAGTDGSIKSSAQPIKWAFCTRLVKD